MFRASSELSKFIETPVLTSIVLVDLAKTPKLGEA